MGDLADFLRARLDEDERAAREAGGMHWRAESDRYGFNFSIIDGGGHAVINTTDDGGTYDRHEVEHIARHDPARVLAEVEAKRRIIAEHALMHRNIGCTPITRTTARSGGRERHRAGRPERRLLPELINDTTHLPAALACAQVTRGVTLRSDDGDHSLTTSEPRPPRRASRVPGGGAWPGA